MAPITISAPKQWQDWVSWVLGIWLCLSPWVLGYGNQFPAMPNAALVGFLLIVTEVITLSVFEPWEEWLNVALGAWLVVCPWVLSPIGAVPATNFVVVGLLVIGLAAYEMQEMRRGIARS
jgi:hypothetical protein